MCKRNSLHTNGSESKDKTRSVVVYCSCINVTTMQLRPPLPLLKELDDEIQLLLDAIDPLVQSVHPLIQSIQDRGLGRLEPTNFNDCTDC